MKFRMLGLNVLEMEEGPFRFLLSQGIPVAYHDGRPEAPAPGWFRSARKPFFTKAMTAHQNKWLHGHAHATVPHDQVVAMLDSLGVYGSKADTSPATPAPTPEAIAGALEYLAGLARQGGEKR